jgi:hypothetical protein
VTAAHDLRRAVRVARWQPRTVLRRLWARFRAAWREGEGEANTDPLFRRVGIDLDEE